MDRQFMEVRVMSQRAGTAESEIKALIEAWADAVRRHDLPAILAHHDDDIIMFDVPPPLQWRGMAEYKKTWDLFFAYHHPGQAFDVEELRMCVGNTVPLRLPSCVAGRPQSVAIRCREASSFV
jgi:ketosteroid isomerase-like protein